MKNAPSSSILLFDGVCLLCSSSVQWILKRDKAGVFAFASLQSPVGQQLLTHLYAGHPPPDSLILIKGDRVYFRSEAVIEIAWSLGFPWSLAVVLRGIPRRWRDSLYDWVARNRYRWFGRSETCWMPKEGWKRRFLQ